MELACHCPAVVCCRCSPQQKADIVRLVKKHTGKRTCAIGNLDRPIAYIVCQANMPHISFLGDGGNDVSMIQAADAGIGIEGKVSICI